MLLVAALILKNLSRLSHRERESSRVKNRLTRVLPLIQDLEHVQQKHSTSLNLGETPEQRQRHGPQCTWRTHTGEAVNASEWSAGWKSDSATAWWHSGWSSGPWVDWSSHVKSDTANVTGNTVEEPDWASHVKSESADETGDTVAEPATSLCCGCQISLFEAGGPILIRCAYEDCKCMMHDAYCSWVDEGQTSSSAQDISYYCTCHAFSKPDVLRTPMAKLKEMPGVCRTVGCIRPTWNGFQTGIYCCRNCNWHKGGWHGKDCAKKQKARFYNQ